MRSVLFLALLLSNVGNIFAQEECVYIEWASFTDTNAVYQVTNGITVDTLGNSYITGYFSGTASFGNFTYTSQGAYDLFVAKIDPDGDFVWVTTAGKKGMQHEAAGNKIVIDRYGNIYLSAGYSRAIDINNQTFTTNEINSRHLVKLNTLGQFEWVIE